MCFNISGKMLQKFLVKPKYLRSEFMLVYTYTCTGIYVRKMVPEKLGSKELLSSGRKQTLIGCFDSQLLIFSIFQFGNKFWPFKNEVRLGNHKLVSKLFSFFFMFFKLGIPCMFSKEDSGNVENFLNNGIKNSHTFYISLNSAYRMSCGKFHKGQAHIT